MTLNSDTLTSESVLERLVSFDTTSRNSNLALINYIAGLFKQHDIESVLLENKDKSKANLYASVGPMNKGGVMLSGHTDVVPVDGQQWTYPAFNLTKENNRYYGRGTTDMKGFVACAIVAAIRAKKQRLATPLHLAFSYDEEIGCVGVHSLLDMLNNAPIKPAMCIVGEPTQLSVATKHKGKMAIIARCTGTEGHSAMAPNFQNAIHLACDLVDILRETQDQIAAQSVHKNDAVIPHTTVHAGRIQAGQALNIVPNLCTVNFEIRHPATDDPLTILGTIKIRADQLIEQARRRFPKVGIEFEILNAYPALATPVDSEVVQFVQSLLNAHDTSSVAFGTEGGLFSQKVGVPTVVCGPGSMEQGHKPDEFIEVLQLQQCDTMLQRLVARLVTS